MKKFALAVLLTAGLVATGFTTSSASAATITVDTTNMTSQAGGDGVPTECSFIDAVAAANTNVAINACTAGDPASTATDTIVLPAGIYDAAGYLSLTESTTITGSSASATVIANTSITLQANSSAPSTMHIQDMSLDSSYVRVSYDDGDLPMTTTIENIYGTGGSGISIYNENPTAPGDVTISNVTLDGDGATEEEDVAILHINPWANGRVYLENSVITNYETGIVNQECARDIFSFFVSLYISTTSIGGGNMATGVQNTCGHLVVDATTFHDIAGAAIVAKTNHMPTVTTYVEGVPTDVTCDAQTASHLELTNNTFTAITPQAIGSRPPAIISLDATLNPECPTQSLVTDSILSMKHNTFTGNTLGAYANIAVTDDTVLDDITLQNNAFEGSAVHGTFSASGSVVGDNNFSTVAYTGPSVLGAAFKLASTFDLTPLTGSTPVGVNNTGGYLTMFRPMWGSPLLDSGSDVGVDTDQRNGPRSLLKQYDIGAVEVARAEVLGDGVTEAQLAAYLGETSPATPNTSAGAGDSDTELANTGAPIALYVAGAVGMSTTGGYALLRQRR